MIVKTVLFPKIVFKLFKICLTDGGSSLSNFSALRLGGLGGIALFNTNQLDKQVKIRGHAVTIFNHGTFFEFSCITIGAKP